MTKIYAIIVTYNALRSDWIDKCLKSLASSSISITPIVVDNGSTDGTREFVPVHFPNIIWLPQKINIGFGQANNIGMRYALEHDADFVLLLNQDARLHPQALEYMIKASDGISIISPLHMNGDGSEFDHMFQKNTLQCAHNQLYYDLLLGNQLQDSYPIGEVAAACWLLPVELIKCIGGFNPLFFQYGEDNNYYQRLLYHHIDVKLCPKAIMYHDRKQHGDNQMFNKTQFHRSFLLITCNINLSLPQIIKKSFQLLIYSYSHGLSSRQYRIGSFGYETIWAFLHLRSILQSRKIEKNIGLNWLSK